MAIKLVDQDDKDYDEWGYESLGGGVELVHVEKGWCSKTGADEAYLEINDNVGGIARIYVADVPKLIKAMQEAIASIKEG